MSSWFRRVASTCLIAGIAGMAHAHHSYAAFSTVRLMKLEATVVEFQFTNPHIWLEVTVKDPVKKTSQHWSLEGSSPNQLARKGWKASSLKPGDKVVVEIYPLKDGRPGGSIDSVVVNGKFLGAKLSGLVTTPAKK